MANIPTNSWDETKPAGSDAISLGDDAIREMKTQIREILGVDHIFEYTGQAENWGYHRMATFIEQAGNPTAVAGACILFTKEVTGKSELHVIDEDSNVVQLTSAGDFVGGILKEVKMWSGLLADIPATWALCDGSGTLPNLVAKFIRGVATAVTNPGATGGSDSNTLSSTPSHTHAMTADGDHQHELGVNATPGAGTFISLGTAYASYESNTVLGIYTYDGTGTEGYIHSHIVDSKGSSVVFENRPAFYELAFIARV